MLSTMPFTYVAVGNVKSCHTESEIACKKGKNRTCPGQCHEEKFLKLKMQPFWASKRQISGSIVQAVTYNLHT